MWPFVFLPAAVPLLLASSSRRLHRIYLLISGLLNFNIGPILKEARNKPLFRRLLRYLLEALSSVIFDRSFFQNAAVFMWFFPPSGFMLSFKGFKCLSPTKQSSRLMLAGINGVLEDSLEMTRMPWPLGRSSSPLTGSMRDRFNAVAYPISFFWNVCEGVVLLIAVRPAESKFSTRKVNWNF